MSDNVPKHADVPALQTTEKIAPSVSSLRRDYEFNLSAGRSRERRLWATGKNSFIAEANEFLLSCYEATKDSTYLDHVRLTLDRMRAGPIYDEKEDGYFRTTTGADWTQPHREKLLAEQAGLLANCLRLFRITQRPEYARMAEEIIGYLDKKLFDPSKPAFFGCEDFLRRDEEHEDRRVFYHHRRLHLHAMPMRGDRRVSGRRRDFASARSAERGRCACARVSLGSLPERPMRACITTYDGATASAGHCSSIRRAWELRWCKRFAQPAKLYFSSARRNWRSLSSCDLTNPDGGYFDRGQSELAFFGAPFDVDRSKRRRGVVLSQARCSERASRNTAMPRSGVRCLYRGFRCARHPRARRSATRSVNSSPDKRVARQCAYPVCFPLIFMSGDDDFVVRIAFPDDISRHAVDFRQRVERHDRGIFHHDAPGLLQHGHALFLIAGVLFFLDELVELRIAVAGAFGHAGVKILIVESVGVVRRSAGIVKRQLAAVDAVPCPNRSDTPGATSSALMPLSASWSRDHLADFLAFEMTVGRQIELDFQTVRDSRLWRAARALFSDRTGSA